MTARHACLLLAGLLGSAAVVLVLRIAAGGDRRAVPNPAGMEAAAGTAGPGHEALVLAEIGPAELLDPGTRVRLAPRSSEHHDPRPDPRDARRRSSVLAGRLTRGASPLAGATLEVTAGLNRGLAVPVQPDGRFRAADLYPGFARVAVRTPAGELERELALRPNVTNELELDLGGGVFVRGRVVDPGGEGVPGAAVLLDGAPVRCDGFGRFQGSTQASGRSWIEVTRAGYARTRVEVPAPSHAPANLAPNVSPNQEPIVVVLAPACRLEIELELPPGHTDVPRLLVIPDKAMRAPLGLGRGAYPWSRLGALEAPGGLLVLEDLPPGDVEVLGFQEGTEGRSVPVRLDPRHPARLTLRLRPLPATSLDARSEPSLSRTLDPLRTAMLALGEHSSETFSRPLEDLTTAR